MFSAARLSLVLFCDKSLRHRQNKLPQCNREACMHGAALQDLHTYQASGPLSKVP